jgi:hypothetical protein
MANAAATATMAVSFLIMANLPNPSRPRAAKTPAPQYRAGFGAVVNAPGRRAKEPAGRTDHAELLA